LDCDFNDFYDFYGFYGFYGFNGFNGFNDLTNKAMRWALIMKSQLTVERLLQ